MNGANVGACVCDVNGANVGACVCDVKVYVGAKDGRDGETRGQNTKDWGALGNGERSFCPRVSPFTLPLVRQWAAAQ